jgi:hypothetical protein
MSNEGKEGTQIVTNPGTMGGNLEDGIPHHMIVELRIETPLVTIMHV